MNLAAGHRPSSIRRHGPVVKDFSASPVSDLNMNDRAANSLLREKAEKKFWGLRERELRVLALVISVKALLFLFAAQSYQVLQNERILSLRGWLEIWNRWDSLNYQKLATLGYAAQGELKPLLVFYPLFPWSVRALAFLSGDYLVSAFFVSTIASLALAVVFLRLLELDYTKPLAQRAVWFLFIFPTSYFLHIGYTESLFLVLALSCIYSARKQRWLLAGVLGGLACMTRANGVVLGPVLAMEIWQQYRTSRRWEWQWVCIVLVAAGFGGYLLLNHFITGNAFAFVTLQREFFGKSLSSPITGFLDALGSMTRSPAEAEMVGTQEVLFITLGLACTIVSAFKLRAAYTVWMAGNWLLFVSVSFVLSVPRYTLTMFPIFILFAMLASRRIWLAVLSVWSILYLSFFSAVFVLGRWAF